MKKSQRLRFYSLIAKQAQGTALGTDEASELKTLTALASTHPDASADTDDTAAAQPAPAAAAPTPAAAAPAAPAAAKPGVSARLAAAMAGLSGGTPAQATAALQSEQQAHAATKATLTQAQADLVAARASLKSTETALAGLCDFFGLKPEEIAGKSADDMDALLKAKISAAATAQIAAIGINPSTLPAPTAAGAKPQTLAELQDAMANTKDPAELGRLAAAANKLRDAEPAKPSV